jgi:hypothetical protein
MSERRLARVEHRQERFDEATGRPVDLIETVLGDALAVVVEVGLQAQGDVLELIALRQQRGEIVLDRRLGYRGVGVVFGAVRFVDRLGVHATTHFSSTISASTISSSEEPFAPVG